MNFGGHLEKFRGQNPRNSKKQVGHGKPCIKYEYKPDELELYGVDGNLKILFSSSA